MVLVLGLFWGFETPHAGRLTRNGIPRAPGRRAGEGIAQWAENIVLKKEIRARLPQSSRTGGKGGGTGLRWEPIWGETLREGGGRAGDDRALRWGVSYAVIILRTLEMLEKATKAYKLSRLSVRLGGHLDQF